MEERDYRITVHMKPNYHVDADKPYFWALHEYVEGNPIVMSGWSATPGQAFIDASAYLSGLKGRNYGNN